MAQCIDVERVEIDPHRVLAPGDFQLADDRLHEGVDRGGPDGQARADLLGGQMPSGQVEDLALAARQVRQPGLRKASPGEVHLISRDLAHP
jgi:hypothetical protein